MKVRHVVASVGLLGSIASLVLACSGAPIASDYDQSCKVDSDCVGVWSGTCEGCQCPNDAINRNEQAKFEGDIQRSGCTPTLACACIQSAVECKSGVCSFVAGGVSPTSSSTGN